MAHGTQQELSRGLSRAGSTAKGGATRLSSMAVKGAKNTAKTAIKTAKNIAKNGVKGGLKATLGASKLIAFLSTPLGWAVLGVLGLLLVIVCVDAHNPSASRNYKEDSIRFSNYNPASLTPSEASSTTDAESHFLDSEVTDYEGDAYIGQSVKQYKEYFEDTFNHVFDDLCKKEVETVISTYGYDYNKTMESYNKCKDPFMDINYAEIICVMSQNPRFSLYNGSLTEIMEWLEDDEHLKYLYYMTVLEKMGNTILWQSEETYGDNFPYDKNATAGTILEETVIPFTTKNKGYSSLSSWFNDKFKSSSKAELMAYAKEVGNEDFEEINGFKTNGRTVITPSTTEKSSWTFITTLKSSTTKTTTVIDKWVYDTYKHKEMPVYKDIEEHEYVVETKLVSTYKYGEIEIFPYSLSDLYKCFEAEHDALNVDHKGITNITLLDEQEVFLRNYGDEEFLGTNTERSPLFSAYTALLNNNLSEANLELQALMSELDLSNFQKNVYEIARSMEGVTYGASFAGFSPFVCCNYVWYVMHLCGIDICPTNMPIDGANAIGLKPSTDIRYRCTLQVYYFKHYQPQAIISTTYNEGMLEVGDIIYTQYDVDYSKGASYNIPKSEWSDHVYIYLGNGYIAEQVGGSYNCVKYRKNQNSYKPATFIVVRPTLIQN